MTDRPPEAAVPAAVRLLSWAGGALREGERALAQEAAVELRYGGLSYATMMASPADLEDLAMGFTLGEAIAEAREVQGIDVRPGEDGAWIVDQRLPGARLGALFRRGQRRTTGLTGCGLCGVETASEALRPLPRLALGVAIAPAAIRRALDALEAAQTLNRSTRAVHAAGLADAQGRLRVAREDVGRHNALDKAIGALARENLARQSPAGDDGDDPPAICVITSRCSYEMAAKAARAGVSVLAAISAPTTLGLAAARASGLTLIGLARDDGAQVFCGAERIAGFVAGA